ncbi:MAG: metal-dependent hydrolase [Candidatus Liptonbacteria bacterium]
MDLFSHVLWSAGLVQLANRHLKAKHKHLRLRPILTAGWGILPDLVVFVPTWVFYMWNLLVGKINFIHVPKHGQLNLVDTDTRIGLFYSFSHSFVVFCVIILLVLVLYWVFTRRKALHDSVLWALAGWGFHILIDVPSHSYEYSSTPFFWPISEWRFRAGLDWGTPTFLFLNYLVLFVLYVFLWYTEPRKKRVHWDNPLA